MMNCERVRNELDDFLYGELSERHAAELRAHLTACKDCRQAREQLERENRLFADFYEQTSFEPSDEAWIAIRDRIRDEVAPAPRLVAGERNGWLAGLLAWLQTPAVWQQAAFAALLIALTVAVTTWVLRRGDGKDQRFAGNPAASPTPQPGASPIPTPTVDLANGTPTPKAAPKSVPVSPQRLAPARQMNEQELLGQQIARAEREYQGAIRLLDRAIAKRRDSFDLEAIKQYEASLALIDQSIGQSRQAFRERPTDVAAGQFLLAAYAKKVELMQDIAMR